MYYILTYNKFFNGSKWLLERNTQVYILCCSWAAPYWACPSMPRPGPTKAPSPMLRSNSTRKQGTLTQTYTQSSLVTSIPSKDNHVFASTLPLRKHAPKCEETKGSSCSTRDACLWYPIPWGIMASSINREEFSASGMCSLYRPLQLER